MDEEQLEDLLQRPESTLRWVPTGDSAYGVTEPRTDLATTLPAGAYEFSMTMLGPLAKRMEMKDEELIPFDEGPTQEIIEEINRFWSLKDRYARLGVPYRRGILMYGPPGTGKSGIMRLVSQSLIAKGGLVAYCSNASQFSSFLPVLNKIEPDRRVVVIFEDVDNMLYDEHEFLQLLDGVGNDRPGMLFLASTNFIDKVPPRVYRPSRFDLLMEVGLPSANMRRQYVENLCSRFGVPMNEELVDKSDGLPFAHVKEVLVSHLLYDKPLDDCVYRMRGHTVEDLTDSPDDTY